MIEADGNITRKVARGVLYYFGDENGVDQGYFFSILIELIAHADDENRAKLSHSFPAEVAAYLLATADNGITTLRLIASQPMTVTL